MSVNAFWKKYYNPKIENDRSEIPTVNIELKKIGSHYQLKTNISNFLNSCLSTNPPKTNIMKADAKVPSA